MRIVSIPQLKNLRLPLVAALLLSACDKPYEARFTLTFSTPGDRTPALVAEQLVSDLKTHQSVRCDAPESRSNSPASALVSETRYHCLEPSGTDIGIVAGRSELVVHLNEL